MNQLLGRAPEIDLISAALRRISLRTDESAVGAATAIVLTGPAGIGKSALLDYAAESAPKAGARVLRAYGVQSEMSFPFAGVHQLVRPVLGAVAATLPGQVAVLRGNGVPEADGAAVGRVGMALLDVLDELAVVRPVIVLVDDAQWLDPPSWDVLGFVGRRLAQDRTAMIITVRTDDGDADRGRTGPALARWATGDGFSVATVGPLDPTAAQALLDRVAPVLRGDLRTHILATASGNPLALVELPRTATAVQPQPELPPWLPLTDRLEEEFAGRLVDLPDTTRTALVVVAANDSEDLGEALTATSHLVGTTVDVTDLTAAVKVGLIQVGDGRIRFAHPLMRSAVYQHAGVAQRLAAHAALAQTLVGEPDRRVVHGALCTTGRDEELSGELVALSARLQSAGDSAGALTALERAAGFAVSASTAAVLILDAAMLALSVGRHDVALRLAEAVDRTNLDAGDRIAMAFVQEAARPGHWTGEERVLALVEVTERLRLVGSADRAIALLIEVAVRMWWSNPSQQVRRRVAAAAEALTPGPDDLRRIFVLAMASPVERGREVIAGLGRVRLSVLSGDAVMLDRIGYAATAVGDYRQSVQPLQLACDVYRRQGRLGSLVQMMCALAWSEFHVGALPRARATAAEALGLAEESGESLWIATAGLAAAATAARRGETAAALAMIEPAERTLLEFGAHPMLAMAQYARACVAIAQGRHSEALDQLRRIYDPADTAYHQYYGSVVFADVADAAAHCDREAEIAPLLAQMRAYADQAAPPLLLAGLAFARPLLAVDDDAEEAFEAALAALTDWPLLRARAQLAFGGWLRRHRRPADARRRLRAAHDAFVALGATPWAEVARGELRAAGEQVTRPATAGWQQLTPQELQISTMAARGLTNREIADSLFLSPRTVSTHLYRIFPKVGVTSRAQLAAALASTDPAGVLG